jgi:hypothetical protein
MDLLCVGNAKEKYELYSWCLQRAFIYPLYFIQFILSIHYHLFCASSFIMDTSMDIDMAMTGVLAPSLTTTSPGTTTRPALARRLRFAPKSNMQGERTHRTSKPYAGRPERRRVDANGMPIDNAGPPPRSGRPGPTSAQLKRLPAGTPPILKGDAAQRLKEKKASQSKLAEMLRSEEMKQWLRSRMRGEGTLDMGVSRFHVHRRAITNFRHYKMTLG